MACTNSSREKRVRIVHAFKTQLLWVFTTMDLLSVQLSIVLQLEL
jgi:hypothetical protein